MLLVILVVARQPLLSTDISQYQGFSSPSFCCCSCWCSSNDTILHLEHLEHSTQGSSSLYFPKSHQEGLAPLLGLNDLSVPCDPQVDQDLQNSACWARFGFFCIPPASGSLYALAFSTSLVMSAWYSIHEEYWFLCRNLDISPSVPGRAQNPRSP